MPISAEDLYQTGLRAEKNGNIILAIKYFGTTTTYKPDFIDAWYRKGLLLEKHGSFKQFLDCLIKLSILIQNTRMLLRRGIILINILLNH